MTDIFSPTTSFVLTTWQKEFVDKYLSDAKTRSLLIAAAGTGKTVVALYLANMMLEQRAIDSTLIITDRIVLQKHWSSSAQSYGIDLAASFEDYKQIDGAVVTMQSLLSVNRHELLEKVNKLNRLLVIVDAYLASDSPVAGLVDELLEGNVDSKALFITSHIPQGITFESQFRFNTEIILERSILELRNTELQIAQFAPSFPILRQLEQGRFAIDDLSWREFEKLIATLLEKDGYSVELMQGSKDGGVDVVAIRDMGSAGYFKTLWQAKKKAQKNKVGISIVRELADTRQEFGASKGIIVTSSYLTSGALQRVERDKYLLGKIDRDDLEQWIQNTLYAKSRYH